jgi:hypothetical protein
LNVLHYYFFATGFARFFCSNGSSAHRLSIAEHLHHLVSAYLLEGRFDPTLVCAMLLPHFICAKLRSQFSPLVLA